MKLKVKNHQKTSKSAKKEFPENGESDASEATLWQFEPDAEEGEEDLKPKNFNQAVTWATDWTTETIVLQLRRGVIDINPNFQRREAWRLARKCRFIESLVLGLPIPEIVLAEQKEAKGKYFVIDGKQRLLTLKQFCSPEDQGGDENDGFVLNDLTIEKELNGKSYKNLLEEPKLNEKLLEPVLNFL